MPEHLITYGVQIFKEQEPLLVLSTPPASMGGDFSLSIPFLALGLIVGEETHG